jgi:AmmeMemoRadiSam system protein A
MLTENEGRIAVQLAKNTIGTYFRTGKMMDGSETELPKVFDEKRGVFVTLTENGMLRGCIGHPYPESTLKYAITDSAISAAFRDPRFPPLHIDEFDKVEVEVTILTPPERIKVAPKDLPSKIEIGGMGLC